MLLPSRPDRIFYEQEVLSYREPEREFVALAHEPPVRLHDHCGASVNDTHIVLVGGDRVRPGRAQY